MLQASVLSVSNISEVCCKCFIQMLQKVDRDVAHVAMVVHACCKPPFSMFHLFFRRMLQMCYLDVAYVFTHMMQIFYLDVAYVYSGLKCFRCFCKCFRRMF